LHNVNIDLLIEAIEKHIPTPKRDPKAEPKFLVVRSFDVNRPGTDPKKLVGGVLGGALVRGKLAVGDEIEIRPGIDTDKGWQPLVTEVVSLATENLRLKEATPGGSIAIGTKLDPNLTKQDAMLGAVAGKPGKLPPTFQEVKLDVKLFDHVVGLEGKEVVVEPLREGEPLIVNVNTTVSLGTVKSAGNRALIALKKPVCADKGDRFVLSRRVEGKWRLIGYGTL